MRHGFNSPTIMEMRGQFDTNLRSVTSLSQMNQAATQPVFYTGMHQAQQSFGAPMTTHYPTTAAMPDERFMTDAAFFHSSIPPHVAMLEQAHQHPLVISSMQSLDYKSEVRQVRSPTIR